MYDLWLQSYIFLHEIPSFLPFFRENAGRFAHIMMRPMSLYESGESSGTGHLKAEV